MKKFDILDIESIKNYLNGTDISAGEEFYIKSSLRMKYRDKFILDAVKGKKVIHLGCVDHLDLIEDKIANGRYLHANLEGVCLDLIGVDINREGVDKMKSLGFRRIYTPDEVDNSIEFDILLIPDVIEHVSNVGLFLESIKLYNVKSVIISTPNAHRLSNRLNLRGELVNTDHKYWFSIYTLTRILFENNIRLVHLELCDSYDVKNPFKTLLKILIPSIRENIVCIGKFNE